MIGKISLILFVILVHSIVIYGQVEISNSSELDTIDFILTEHNNISVEAILNDKDTINLMFHTAVSSVSLTPDQSEKLNQDLEKKSSEATSWSGTKDVEYLENNKLEIAGLEWSDMVIWLNMLSGHETDGKFGPNLFEGKIIEIDYDRKILVLHDSTSLNLDSFTTFDILSDEHNALFVEGELLVNDKPFKNKFMIHSGYGGTLILDDHFCELNKDIKALAVFEKKELKDSMGNIIDTKKAVADGFQIFNMKFEDVPFSYFDSDLEIQKTSVIGGAMLKRFNLLLDIRNKKLHVKSNGFTNSEFSNS